MKKLIKLFIIAITLLIAYSCCSATGQSRAEVYIVYRSSHGDYIKYARMNGRIIYFVETTDGRIRSVSVL